MRYLVKIYRYKGDYSAEVPDLPGCVAAGDSIEEVHDLIKDAIRLHIDLLRKAREPIPKPRRQTAFKLDDLEDDEYCTWVKVARKQPA